MRSRKHVLLGFAITIGLAGIGALTVPTVAAAVQASQPTLVSVVPPAYTPNIDLGDTGVVYAIAKVGTTVYVGGEFTSISPHNDASQVTTVTNLAAFSASNGAILTSFAPIVDGDVNTIAPGPTPGTVYVGGSFKTIDGTASRLALLNATTGAIVPGWASPKGDGPVNRLELSGGQLFVGGFFNNLSSQTRHGLATLNPTTGALTSYSTLGFTGHHNFGVNCTSGTCAQGSVGVRSFDISPDGTHMAVLGNFTDVSGTSRDQAAMLDLGTASATVDPNWNTDSFTSGCAYRQYDSFVRDVQFSPDGSYFAVAVTGAGGAAAVNSDGTKAVCDAVARFETNATGSDVQPTWVDWSGNDSFWSVAVTGAAIYAGGHPRWMNNGSGSDTAQEGAVPRPGIVGLDPQNGLPFTWNPGRNPRGAGAYALLATSDGLYVGSDTDYIGNFQYKRAKIAYFPLAGGETPPPNVQGNLPGTVYLFGPPSSTSVIKPITWDGSTAPTVGSNLTGFDASNVRGAFDVDGALFYWASGTLFKSTFENGVVGSPTTVDPYNDPVWSNQSTGTGPTTYRGLKSSFYSELPTVTSMFYSSGRVYYTLSGKSQMFYRYFETDDGVTGWQEHTTTDVINWSGVSGAFLSGSTLYFANAMTGALMSVPFVNGQASGTPVVADSSTNWKSHGAVLIGGGQTTNQPPTASFTVNCPTPGGSCKALGSASHDPDGSIVSYRWSWGDGKTSQTTTPTAFHTYAASGTYTVTLTVTDDGGLTGTDSHSVDYTTAPGSGIAFRASTAVDVNAAAATVTVPPSVQSGDEMLLFDSFASNTATAAFPHGWTKVGAVRKINHTTIVYAKQATSSDLGSKITVTLSGAFPTALTLAAYSNALDPVETAASATDANTASHTSSNVTGLVAGSYAVSYWSDRSTTTSAWTAPGTVSARSTVYGTGASAISALLADSGSPVSGSYGGKVATTNVTSASGISWTVGLTPAP